MIQNWFKTFVTVCVALCAAGVAPAAAQQLVFPKTEQGGPRVDPPTAGDSLGTLVVTVTTPVLPSPQIDGIPLRVAKEGSIVTALESTGDWYRIEFNDPQRGRSTGFIQKQHARLEAPAPVLLQPAASAVDAAAPVTLQPASHTSVPQGTAVPTTPTASNSAWTPSSSFQRVWLDVNVGLAMSGADLATFQFENILATAYDKPSRGADFDFGGGFMFTPRVGAGVSFTGTAHRDVVGLGSGVGNIVLGVGVTDELPRTEAAANLQMMVAAINTDKFSLRLFGGPSYFRYEADMVSDFTFAATNYRTVKTEGTGWGFHGGADASVFFARVVGLGGFARYSRGTASVFEPLSETTQDITLGGFQTGGGLRLRF